MVAEERSTPRIESDGHPPAPPQHHHDRPRRPPSRQPPFERVHALVPSCAEPGR